MRYRTKVILISLVIGALLLPLIGCTLVGYSIGALADSGKPPTKQVPGWKWRNIKHREELTVILRNGLIDTGRFLMACEQERPAYALRFKARGDSVAAWPAPGKQVTIHMSKGDTISGTLVGYDQWFGYTPDSPKVRSTDTTAKPTYLLGIVEIRSDAIEKPRRIDCRLIAQLSESGGVPVSGASTAEAITERQLPCLTSLVIEKPSGAISIPIDDIEQLWVKNHRHGKTTGLIVGAAIDVTLITMAIIIASMDFEMGNWEVQSSDNGAYSCPFVYAYDGTTYHRQAEVFGGAIFQGAQRTDWVTLDSLRPVNDVCRLRITNELDETQYVDELSLLAVDHRAGTSVVPSFDGALHVIDQPLAPQSARSDNGADQTAAVREADDRIWVSNPFGRDAAQPKQVRDGLELTFPMQAEDSTATLVVRGKNTRWSAEMLAEVLRLQGDSLAVWYRMLNNSERERARLAKAMIREGMLIVKVWQDSGWRDADMIWDVGPVVPRQVAVRLTKIPREGRTLKVRLESTAGFWMIDQVSVSYHDAVPAKVTRVSACRAVDQLGKSRVSALDRVDRTYYEMATTSDLTDLEFRVPPQVAGTQRSYVVQCNGYYTIHAQGHGVPDPELMARLLDEPGAYGRYTLELLNRKVREAWAANDTTTSK